MLILPLIFRFFVSGACLESLTSQDSKACSQHKKTDSIFVHPLLKYSIFLTFFLGEPLVPLKGEKNAFSYLRQSLRITSAVSMQLRIMKVMIHQIQITTSNTIIIIITIKFTIKISITSCLTPFRLPPTIHTNLSKQTPCTSFRSALAWLSEISFLLCGNF